MPQDKAKLNKTKKYLKDLIAEKNNQRLTVYL